MIRTRLLSLALVLAVGFVLMVSLVLVLNAALAALHGYLPSIVAHGGDVWRGVNLVTLLAVISLLLATIDRVLPTCTSSGATCGWARCSPCCSGPASS